MNFNQTTIGLLLFYSTGLLLVIGLFLLALPALIARQRQYSKEK